MEIDREDLHHLLQTEFPAQIERIGADAFWSEPAITKLVIPVLVAALTDVAVMLARRYS